MAMRTAEVDLKAQTTLDQAITALLAIRRRDVPGDATLVWAAALMFEYATPEGDAEHGTAKLADITPEPEDEA